MSKDSIQSITRRRFVRGAASAALAGPLLANPALMRLGRAADFSGETLKFMIINPHAGSIEPLSAAFAELTGAEVEAVKVPYDQITAQSTLDVMSGTNDMDVFQFWYVDKEALVRDGVLADVTDRIDADPDIDPPDFLGSLYDAYTLVDGRRYGLPYDGDTHVLFYNSTILERNGQEPPKTWDEYTAVAKAITEAEGASDGTYGCLLMCKQFPIIICSTYANRLGGFGGDFLSADGKPALATEASIAAAQAMVDAGPWATPTPLETEFGNSIPVFLGGQAGMIEFWTDLGTWAQDPEQSQIVDQWGVVPMPVGGSNTVNRPAMNAGWSFGVSSGSTNPDMAWEFVRMASSKDMHVAVLTNNKTGVDPTRRSAMPAYREFAPLQADAVEQAIDDAFPWPTKPESPELMQNLADELAEMMAGAKTAEEAMNDAQANWESILG